MFHTLLPTFPCSQLLIGSGSNKLWGTTSLPFRTSGFRLVLCLQPTGLSQSDHNLFTRLDLRAILKSAQAVESGLGNLTRHYGKTINIGLGNLI